MSNSTINSISAKKTVFDLKKEKAIKDLNDYLVYLELQIVKSLEEHFGYGYDYAASLFDLNERDFVSYAKLRPRTFQDLPEDIHDGFKKHEAMTIIKNALEGKVTILESTSSAINSTHPIKRERIVDSVKLTKEEIEWEKSKPSITVLCPNTDTIKNTLDENKDLFTKHRHTKENSFFAKVMDTICEWLDCERPKPKSQRIAKKISGLYGIKLFTSKKHSSPVATKQAPDSSVVLTHEINGPGKQNYTSFRDILRK